MTFRTEQQYDRPEGNGEQTRLERTHHPALSTVKSVTKHNTGVWAEAARESPVINVSRTPAIQVVNTPAAFTPQAALLKRPRTAPAAILNTPLPGPSLPRSKSDSWETPPSVVPDSQPSYTSLKRAFAEAVESSMGNGHVSSPTAKRQQFNHVTALENQMGTYPASLSFHLPQSESMAIVEEHEAPSSSGLPLVGGTPNTVEHTAQGIVDTSVTPRTRCSQALPVRSSQSSQLSNKTFTSLHSSSPVPPLPTSPPLPSQQEDILYQIRPPAPPTGDGEIGSHLTPSLNTITKTAPVAQYFKPKARARPIRALERGHWHFCIPPEWPHERKSKFWAFLEKFVRDGRAGWSVRVERCITRTAFPESDTSTPAQDSDSSIRGVIKEQVSMFCFGEVVGELWLVLWLASDRQIVGLGAEWIDGMGDTVIKMR
jgi:hypothetical protein